MPFGIFKKIISDCENKPVKKINFFWFGDPFCNPRIIEYLQYARQKLPKVKFYISTNAELLTSPLADKILENCLLDVINFDVDGVKKQTYESIRRGVNFDLVLSNINYFMKKKKKLNLRKPQLRMTIIKMRETISEIAQFKKKWSRQADKVDVNDFNTWLGYIEDKNTGKKLEESKSGFFAYPCIHPWNELVISSEGEAGLCCLDYNLTASLGKITDEAIEQIWHGETLRNYRKKLIKLDYKNISCCANCNNYIYQDNTFWARIWK